MSTKKRAPAFKDPHAAREAAKYDHPIPSREVVLECLAAADQLLSLTELAEKTHAAGALLSVAVNPLALALFNRAWKRARWQGIVLDEEKAGRLYAAGLSRILQQEGVVLPEALSSFDPEIEMLLKEEAS